MSSDLTISSEDARTDARRRRVALIALSLTFGVVQLDATIVNVALETLRTDLGGGVSAAQWVVDGYAVPFAACMLSAGALGDRYGHRRACVAGFAVFGLASVMAALARSVTQLIAARAVQGIGAAIMLPASLAMITTLYPEQRERSRALGIWGGIATVGFAAGPLLGGVLITVSGWPAIFWINLPIAGLVGGTIAVLGRDAGPRHRLVHPVATALGIAALAALASGIIEAGEGRLAPAAVLIAVGIAAGCWFAAHERRSSHPLVPRALLGAAAYRWGLATGFAFNFPMYGVLLCVSLLLQGRYGYSALAGGLAALPMALVVSVGATLSGYLTAAMGPRRPMIAGFGCAAASLGVVAWGGLVGSPAIVVVGLGGLGLCSLAMPAMTSVTLGAAPAEHAGLASGSLNTARQIGGAVGVAALGAVLNAGGARSGFTVAVGLAVASCLVGIATSVAATARPRGDACPPSRRGD
jgi:DHA2 family methylenomycin A resistance protein-like MFS transporter